MSKDKQLIGETEEGCKEFSIFFYRGDETKARNSCEKDFPCYGACWCEDDIEE